MITRVLRTTIAVIVILVFGYTDNVPLHQAGRMIRSALGLNSHRTNILWELLQLQKLAGLPLDDCLIHKMNIRTIDKATKLHIALPFKLAMDTTLTLSEVKRLQSRLAMLGVKPTLYCM